ncbi:kinase domain-containing protein [Fusarium pseudoanthophilum]|uniref:Kinase domain-containing protein n=1 Tax=Fusarium pseudoanthophilum TaxID=48495 RepID=A0A8H5NLK2_9HYPO|nr:kinase domain-containing protein [Fusarium pseudoanthophilum]
MEDPSPMFKGLGRCILDAFESLADRPWVVDERPSRNQVLIQHQRFLLWARSLGLNQIGHASLDYRLRDSTVVRDTLANVLHELGEHLGHSQVSSIIIGNRLPLEQDAQAQQDMAATAGDNRDSDDESVLSSVSSIGSFKEIDFRFASLVTRIDSLYELALIIRNPQNRPQRSNRDLYTHIPATQRDEYIDQQIEIETARLSYVHSQQLLRDFDHQHLFELNLTQGQLLEKYSSATNWLIRRTGQANARRKQQFIYWRTHAGRLAHDVVESQSAVDTNEIGKTDRYSPDLQDFANKSVPPISMATTATGMISDTPGQQINPELSDSKSVISRESRVSTAISPTGETLTWPLPPKPLGDMWFSCPYCGILCPEEYLGRDEWRVHQIHDLQPYHCTYEDCTDPNRVYGSRQDWIDHENQHRRVWHCHVHGEEFETQPEYIQHLREAKDQHKPQDEFPEMIAAAVGSSKDPNRDCPFCPTDFVDVRTMQKHIRYHLERLSLYVLPDIYEHGGGDSTSVQSSESMKLLGRRGRKNSIIADFSTEESDAFSTDIFDPPVRESLNPSTGPEDLAHYLEQNNSMDKSFGSWFMEGWFTQIDDHSDSQTLQPPPYGDGLSAGEEADYETSEGEDPHRENQADEPLWILEMPLEDQVIGEDNTFHTQNASLGDWEGRNVFGRTTADIHARVELLSVNHGSYNDGEEKATLLVLRFRFDPQKRSRRVLRARVQIEFFAEDESTLMVDSIAPEQRWMVVPTPDTETTTRGGQLKSDASGLPSREAGASASLEKTYSRDVKDATTITGSKNLGTGKDSGDSTVAVWNIQENEIRKTGVPDSVTTTILLRRSSDERFSAVVTLEAEIDRFTRLERKFAKTPLDHPILFNPKETTALGKKGRSFGAKDLASVDLNQLCEARFAVEAPFTVK